MFELKTYKPHVAQEAFHYYIQEKFRFLAMICGIRGGKTYAGAREALKQAWNSKQSGVYGIIAPTYHMLKRTTWREFKIASSSLIASENDSDKIIVLRNGREVHGFSADKPDRIRNSTLNGFWLDEGRECKEGIWEILLGRVLSTGGKGIMTTSPNSFDWIHEEFIERQDKDYGVIKFRTHDNTYLDQEAISSLERKYDEKFARQELYGEFVVFEGAVYYTFSRDTNAGHMAFRVARYDASKPIELCCDFNVDPMAWVLCQFGINAQTGLKEAYAVDEIYLRNSHTQECCKEFKDRYPNHNMGINLYGDATGKARSSSSNVTNWQIIEDELRKYGINNRVPSRNPAERDRVNAVNAFIKNSKGENRLYINPDKCKHLISDLEQVSYKEGSSQIDKAKDSRLTHASDAIGYMIEDQFSLRRNITTGIPI